MNKIYRLIRHRGTGAWIPVSEITRSKQKSSNKRLLLSSAISMAFVGCFGVGFTAMAAEQIIEGTYSVPGDHTTPWMGQDLNLIIGNTGSGNFLVGDGTTATLVRVSSSTVGKGASADGTVTINAAATWNTKYTSNAGGSSGEGNLTVGESGTGKVYVVDGGKLDTSHAYLGVNAGSDGYLEVSGSGSKMTGGITVGGGSTGELLIHNGGTLDGTGRGATIGDTAGGIGIATVSGTGSKWTMGDMGADIGYASGAKGTLTVEQGAQVEVQDFSYLSIGRAGKGEVFVTGPGSSFSDDGGMLQYVYVGQLDGGDGTLTVSDGATASFTTMQFGIGGSDESAIDKGANSTGVINVMGGGSSMTVNATEIMVGQYGTGTLNVTEGANFAGSGTFFVGARNGAIGNLNVSGTDSQLTATSIVLAGSDPTSGDPFGVSTPAGNGTMTVSAGGKVDATNVVVGRDEAGVGKLVVTGPGSEIDATGNLFVGAGRDLVLEVTGEMLVEDGAVVRSATAGVGYGGTTLSNGTGIATVTGTGSQWITTDMTVGHTNASGELTIADGAVVDVSSGVVTFASDVTTTTGKSVLNIGAGGLAGTLNATQVVSASPTSGTPVNYHLVNFNHTDDIAFAPQLTGDYLAVGHIASGTTTLTAANDYFGPTTVTAGTLQAGALATLSANSAYVIGSGGTLDLASFDHTLASLDNAGTVTLSAAGDVGTTLTVDGDYIGSGGTIVFNTELKDDTSVTDKMLVNGNTSGSSNVQVNNVGGAGAQTTSDGIQIIEVVGNSNGAFALQGRAVAGAYEYFLYQGGNTDPNDGDWYLRSTLASVDPDPDPQVPVNPDGTVDPDPLTPAVLRPELGIYLTNQRTAMSMFEHTMHERMGEPGLSGIHDGNTRGAGWARVRSSKLDAGTVGRQLETESDLDMVQVGADMQREIGADGRLHLGAMAGYGYAKTRAHSLLSGYDATGRVKGTSLGIYGTWFQNNASVTGLYVDSWLQYGTYDNEVRGQLLRKEKYDSTTWSGSVEAGYAFALHEDEAKGYYIEPQAQVIYTRYRGDAHTEANGTDIARQSNNHTTTRLGVRAYSRPLNYGDGNRTQPFVLLNWWSGGDDAVVRMNGVSTRHRIANDRYEVRLGAQTELGQGWSGWGSFGVLWGSSDFRDYDGQLGLKYSW